MPPRSDFQAALGEELERVEAAGLWRELREIEGEQAPSVVLRGREVLLFCSNNYLGLANHPEVVEASREAAARYGASAGSSRLISGHMRAHREFEECVAQLEGARSRARVLAPATRRTSERHRRAGGEAGDVVLSAMSSTTRASSMPPGSRSADPSKIFRHNDTAATSKKSCCAMRTRVRLRTTRTAAAWS